MPGIKALRKIQLGQETTAGTPVAATTIWRGEGVLNDERTIEFPAEDVGLYAPTDRMYIPKIGATLSMDDTPATFEQLVYVLSGCLSKVTTAAADGVGSGKVWTYNVASTAAPTQQLFTIEMGDDNRVDKMEYAYVEKFSLSGAKGEAVMLAADWRGRQATDGDFTGALSIPTVEEILFSKGKLYIDPTTIGTTQKTATWLGFNLEIPGGWKAVWTGDGNLYFTQTVYKGTREEEMTGELTLEHDATAEAEIVAARAGTLRLVRLLFNGTALTTAATYTYKTLKIDMAIKYTEVPQIEDEDEDDVVTLPFKVVYSSTAALFASVVVVNQLATLT